MLRTVTALRWALDTPPRLSVPDAVKLMSEMMGLPCSSEASLPEQVEALVEATGLSLDEVQEEPSAPVVDQWDDATSTNEIASAG